MLEPTQREQSGSASSGQLNSSLNKKLLELFLANRQSQCDKWATFKVGAVAVGTVTGIPSVRIARKLAGDNPTLAFIYPYSMIVSVASLSIWSLLDFIHFQQIRLRPPTDQVCGTYLFRPISVVGMSILTTFPYIIISYKYNNGEIIYPIITFVTDVILNISPFNRNLRLLTNYLSVKTPPQIVLETIRNLFLARINKGIEVLISLSPQERQAILDKFNRLNADQPAQANLLCLELLSDVMILGKNTNSPISERLLHKCIRYSLIGTSFIFPAAWAIIITKVMYQAVITIITYRFFSMLIALAISVPPYLLEGILSRLLNFKAYQAIQDMRYGNYYRNYSQRYYFSPYLLLTAIALFTVAFSFASRTQVTRDEINNNTIYLLLPIIVFSTIFYKASAMLSLVPEIIESYARRFSRPEMQDLPRFLQKLKEYSAILGDVSIEEFASFYDESKEIIMNYYKDDELIKADEAYELTKDTPVEVTEQNLYVKTTRYLKNTCTNCYSLWSIKKNKERASDAELHEPLSTNEGVTSSEDQGTVKKDIDESNVRLAL